MSGLVVGFAMQMHRRATNAQKGTTPGLEVSEDKRSRLFRSDEEIQADPAVIDVDSPERVLKALSSIGGASQDASRKACAALEDEIPTREFPHVDDVSIKALLIEATGAQLQLARWASFAIDGAQRPPDRLVLSLYVEPIEWVRPMEDVPAPDQEIARGLINY